MKKQDEEKIVIIKSSGNVFADLGFQDAEKMLAKAELARKINGIIVKRKLKQKAAAALLGIDQPKISALRRGRFDDFSIERLIIFLNRLNRDVEIIVKEPTGKHIDKQGHLKVAFG